MKNFIHVHRWCNRLQNYQYAGHLLYENELTGGAVSFFYDAEYIRSGGAPLDPKNMPTDKNQGRHVVTFGNGVLPLYFQQLLPGAYGQLMLKNEFMQFDRLNQFQKLSICAELFGDHIAIQLNAQNPQNNMGATSHSELSKLATAFIDPKPTKLKGPLGSDRLIATCSLPGNRSKIEYSSKEDGQRYILKPNASSHYNESKVRQFTHMLELSAGVDSAALKMLPLQDSDIEVAIQQNFKHHFTEANGQPFLLKFNSVGFDVLHGENALLSPSPAFSYKDAANILDNYSANPQEDKEQLLIRAILSAAMNHTTNGLDNFALIDHATNHWRLAPAYNTLPNPLQESTFALRFGDHQVSRMHFEINMDFAKDLAASMRLDPEIGVTTLEKVENALLNRHSLYIELGIDSNSQHAIEQAIEAGRGIQSYSHPSMGNGFTPSLG